MSRFGFTLIELIVVVSILSTLLGLVVINLLNTSIRTNINATEQTLVGDLRNQQMRAIVGDLGDLASTKNYGIYFGIDTYTLFQGDSYEDGKLSNFIINLPGQTQFADILLPSSQIVFASGSGEIINFSQSSSSFVLQDLSGGDRKTFRFNKYGVITSVE